MFKPFFLIAFFYFLSLFSCAPNSIPPLDYPQPPGIETEEGVVTEGTGEVDVDPGDVDAAESECKTLKITLKNGEGIIFNESKIVQREISDIYNIYFEDDKFYSIREFGSIAKVGDMGNMKLCKVNYPESGFCDESKIIKNHVYIYESYDENIKVEFRVKSYKKSIEVKISYHVRKD